MTKLEYERKDGEIVIITWKYDVYELNVFTNKEDAEDDILNCHKCNYLILEISDDDLHKKYLEESKSLDVVDSKGMFYATT